MAIEHTEAFKKIAGRKMCPADEESLNNYAHDETEDLHFLPDVVIKARNTQGNKCNS